MESGLKVVFAVVDLVTLGGAVAATKLSEVGLKEALKAFGKTVAVDFDAIKDKNGNYVLDADGNRIPSENSYDSIAKAMDAQYFNLENWDELSSQYSGEEIWKINEKFLDIQTSSGREIYLSHNPMDYVGDGSYYSKEVQYLMDNGYRFIKEGEIWHAIR